MIYLYFYFLPPPNSDGYAHIPLEAPCYNRNRGGSKNSSTLSYPSIQDLIRVPDPIPLTPT